MMVEGEMESVLVGDGDSAEEPPRLVGAGGTEVPDALREPEVEYGLGLSLPVGPLPRTGRLAGGRLRAARRVLFSSSNSETRCSRA